MPVTRIYVAPYIAETASVPAHGRFALADDYTGPVATPWRMGTVAEIRPDWAIVRIEFPQAADYAEVDADPDMRLIATDQNIRNPLTVNQANRAQAWLESRDLPAQIAEAGITRRQLIRRIVTVMTIDMELRNRFGTGWRDRLRQSGLSFASTWAELPARVKSELRDFSLDNGFTAQQLGLSGSSTVREILTAFGREWTRRLPLWN